MSFGDQGTPCGSTDPYTRWVVEQERIRRRRRTRRAAVAGAGTVLVAALTAGAVLYAGDDGTDEGGTAAAASSTAPPAPSATGALPSLLSRPVIRPEQAFPATSVRLDDGSRYERVDLATTTDCSTGLAPELAALVERGRGCARLTAALFTDAERRSQVTVTVLSFRRVEDASTVFAMASMDPVAYQVVSLDPPPRSGLPTVPPGSAGVFRRSMTVRSVVFANGQWGDGTQAQEAAITRQTEDVLRYAHDNVVAYEDPSAV
ncbi:MULTISPECIES: hypothetical protein [unclassified Streptomyces]|uniref:hypothetical protein n=1 Tax=unclassified Streptomyces TaxID=2593676 RepID=UPI0036EE0DE5